MLPLDEIIATLKDHLKDNALVLAISKDLIAAEKELKAAKEPIAKTKTRLVALLRSDDLAVKRAAEAGVFILSVPDDDSTSTYSGDALLSRLRKAAQEHNDSPKRRRSKGSVKIVTWTDLVRNVRAKTYKASESVIGVKAKGNTHELVVLTSESIAP